MRIELALWHSPAQAGCAGARSSTHDCGHRLARTPFGGRQVGPYSSELSFTHRTTGRRLQRWGGRPARGSTNYRSARPRGPASGSACGAWVRSVAAISGPLPGASRVRGWGVVGARSRHSAGDKRVTGGDGGRGRCLSARQEPERPSSTRTHVFTILISRYAREVEFLVFRSSYAGTAGTRYRLRPLNTGPTTTPPRGRPHAPHGDPDRTTVHADATSIRPPSGIASGYLEIPLPARGSYGERRSDVVVDRRVG